MGLFERYPATPESIWGTADTTTTAGQTCRTVGADVASGGRQACTSVDGDVLPALQAAPDPVVATADDLERCAIVATGCLNQWGTYVSTYNAGIDDLNRRWSAAAADSFGVSGADYQDSGGPGQQEFDQTGYDGAVASARSTLRAQLVAEKQQLDADLDDSATAVAGMLDEGPSDRVALALVQAGALPQTVDPNLLGELWGALRGQALWPTDQGALGVAAWGVGRAGFGFGVGQTWKTRVQQGRFAPRGYLPNGRYGYLPWRNAPWYTNAYRAAQGSNWQAKPYQSTSYSRWATAGKWASRGGAAIGFATAGYSQYLADANDPTLSTSERVGRIGTRTLVQGGAGWGGAVVGGKVGAGIGFAVGGPVGAVVGGVVGGIVGGVIGSGIGNEIADHVVEFGGELAEGATELASDALDTAGEALDDAGETISDGAEAVGDFFGF